LIHNQHNLKKNYSREVTVSQEVSQIKFRTVTYARYKKSEPDTGLTLRDTHHNT